MLLGGLMYVVWAQIQPVLDYRSCPLCDGNFYAQLYNNLKTGNWIPVKSPFHTRLLIPALVSVMPFDDFFGFWLINLFFAGLSSALIWIAWRVIGINFWFRIGGIIWFWLHWIGLRHHVWDYITVDMPVYAIHALLVIIIAQKKYSYLIPFAVFSVLVKESIVPLLVVAYLAICLDDISKDCVYRHLVFVWGAGAAFMCLIFLQKLQTTNQVSSVRIALHHLKELIYEPQILLRWLLALFWTYGLGFWAVVFASGLLARNTSKWLLVLSVGYIFIGLIGGRDASRILFLGYPFMMGLVLFSLQTHPKPIKITFAVLSLIFLRLTEVFTQKYGQQYLDFFPESAQGIAFFYFWIIPLTFSAMAWLIYKFSSPRHENSNFLAPKRP